MRRLANLKNLNNDSSEQNGGSSTRKYATLPSMKSKKGNIAKNNPYPLSGRPNESYNSNHNTNGHLSFAQNIPTSQRSRHSSLSHSHSKRSISISHDSQTGGNKSRAPTLATQAETALSDAAPSGVGTGATATTKNTDGGRDSTFSSPAHSIRSMATTLTTVQSVAAPAQNQANSVHPPALTHTSTAQSSIHAYPQPATAVPAHLAPHTHPTTYHTATANNVLTDDASILTLASSSKRRRRNSVDTNASMKALAPASMFGGSRESLPLSVLSGTVIYGDRTADSASLRGDGAYTRSTLNAERASLISASGVAAPALASERNSYIGSKYGNDAASVRSGFLGAHGRADSLSGSITGAYREKDKEAKDLGKEKEKIKESENEGEVLENGNGMVTAPTSPLVDGNRREAAGTSYVSALDEAVARKEGGHD
jgi:hypothetical protein